MLLFIQLFFPSTISTQIFYKLSGSKLTLVDSIMKYSIFVFINNLVTMSITSFFSGRDLTSFYVISEMTSFNYIWKQMIIALPISIIVAIMIYIVTLNFDLKVYRK